jgi:hypothetical protein
MNTYLLDQLLHLKVVLKINLFITLLTFVVLRSLQLIKTKFPDKVGFCYLAFMLLKMALSIVFLFPFIKEKPENLKAIIFSFFTIFFCHLFYEAYSVVKWLKHDENH